MEGLPPLAGALQLAPLGKVAVNAVDRAVTDFTRLLEELPSKDDYERKQRLSRHLHTNRQQLVRLLSLYAWSKKAAPLQCVAGPEGVLDLAAKHSRTLDHVATDLYESYINLRNSTLPKFDVESAWEVLTTGTYGSLPTCIADLCPPPPLPALRQERLVSHMNHLIYQHLDKVHLPPGLQLVGVANGCVVMRCPSLYEVKLGLVQVPEPPPAPSLGLKVKEGEPGAQVKPEVGHEEGTSVEEIATENRKERWLWFVLSLVFLPGAARGPPLEHVQLLALMRDLNDRMRRAADAAVYQRRMREEGLAPESTPPAGPSLSGLSTTPSLTSQGPQDVDGQEYAEDEVTSPVLAMHAILRDISSRLLLDEVRLTAHKLAEQGGKWDGHLRVEPSSVLVPGVRLVYWLKAASVYAEDVRGVGHGGTSSLEVGIGKHGMVEVVHLPRLYHWSNRSEVNLVLDTHSVDVEALLLQAASVNAWNQLRVLQTYLRKGLAEKKLRGSWRVDWMSEDMAHGGDMGGQPEVLVHGGLSSGKGASVVCPVLEFSYEETPLLHISRHLWTGKLILRQAGDTTTAMGNIEILSKLYHWEARLEAVQNKALQQHSQERAALHACKDVGDSLAFFCNDLVLPLHLTEIIHAARRFSLHLHIPPTRLLNEALAKIPGSAAARARRQRSFLEFLPLQLPRSLPTVQVGRGALLMRSGPSLKATTPASTPGSMTSAGLHGPQTPGLEGETLGKLPAPSPRLGSTGGEGTSAQGALSAASTPLDAPRSLSFMLGMDVPFTSMSHFNLVMSICNSTGMTMAVHKCIPVPPYVTAGCRASKGAVGNAQGKKRKREDDIDQSTDKGNRETGRASASTPGSSLEKTEGGQQAFSKGGETSTPGISAASGISTSHEQKQLMNASSGGFSGLPLASSQPSLCDVMEPVVQWCRHRMIWEKLVYELGALQVSFQERWPLPGRGVPDQDQLGDESAAHGMDPCVEGVTGTSPYILLTETGGMTLPQCLGLTQESPALLVGVSRVELRVARWHQQGEWVMQVYGRFYGMASCSQLLDRHCQWAGDHLRFTYSSSCSAGVAAALADLQRLISMQLLLHKAGALAVGLQQVQMLSPVKAAGDRVGGSSCSRPLAVTDERVKVNGTPCALVAEDSPGISGMVKESPLPTHKRPRVESPVCNGDVSPVNEGLVNGRIDGEVPWRHGPPGHLQSKVYENGHSVMDPVLNKGTYIGKRGRSHAQGASCKIQKTEDAGLIYHWEGTGTLQLSQYSPTRATLECWPAKRNPSGKPSRLYRYLAASLQLPALKTFRKGEVPLCTLNIEWHDAAMPSTSASTLAPQPLATSTQQSAVMGLAPSCRITSSVLLPRPYLAELEAMLDQPKAASLYYEGMFLDTLAITLWPTVALSEKLLGPSQSLRLAKVYWDLTRAPYGSRILLGQHRTEGGEGTPTSVVSLEVTYSAAAAVYLHPRIAPPAQPVEENISPQPKLEQQWVADLVKRVQQLAPEVRLYVSKSGTGMWVHNSQLGPLLDILLQGHLSHKEGLEGEGCAAMEVLQSTEPAR